MLWVPSVYNFAHHMSRSPHSFLRWLAQVMAWQWRGDRQLPEPMLTKFHEAIWCLWVSLSLTHCGLVVPYGENYTFKIIASSSRGQWVNVMSIYTLTQCGLVMPYGGTDLGQHWRRYWLVAWQHQAITWTNVDLSLIRSSDNHQKVISQKIPQPSIIKISWRITYLKFHSNLPGANDLSNLFLSDHMIDLHWIRRVQQCSCTIW